MKKPNCKAVFLFIFICLIYFASSALAELKFDDLISKVKKSYPLIVSVEQEKFIAQGKKLSAEGGFDVKWKTKTDFVPEGYYKTQRLDSVVEKPTDILGLSVYGGYRLGEGNFAVYDGKYETTPPGEVRAGIQIPILRDRDIDERRAKLASSDFGLSLAEQNIGAKKIEIIKKASLKYWSWVAYGQRIGVVKNLLDIAEQRDSAIKQRVKQGDIAVFESKDNQRNILQRKMQLVKAERAFQEASIELSLFIRDESGTPILPTKNELPSKFPRNLTKKPYNLDELSEKAINARPELQALKLEREQMMIESRLAENQLLPKLDFAFEVSKDLGDGNKTKEPTDVGVGLNIEIPLQRRSAEGSLQSANAKIIKLDNEIRFQKDRIKADIQDSLSLINNTQEQLSIVSKELKFARELEQGERERFKAGDSNILFINLREQASADTAVREIDALAEFYAAEALLKAALGEY